MPELFGFRLLQNQPGLVAALQIAEEFPLVAIPVADTTATHSALSAKVGADEPPSTKGKDGGSDGTNPGGAGGGGTQNPGQGGN